uniref:Uncharacterized protein n=1 Tax=Oncorhynchus mykiss TaxID=8022 RepID=A0A8K9XQH4_ONCMY
MIIGTDDVNEKLVQVVCQPEYEPRRLDLLLRLPRPRLFAIDLQSGSVHFSTIIGSQLLLLSATYSVLVLTTMTIILCLILSSRLQCTRAKINKFSVSLYPQCDADQQCAVGKGARIGKLCECSRGTRESRMTATI